MSNTDDQLLSDVADIAQTEERVEAPTPEAKTETNTDSTADDEQIIDDQDFSRVPWDEREKEEPSKTETETETETNTPSEEVNTETETKTQAESQEVETPPSADDDTWKATLPQAPQEFNLPAPEFDEDGNVTNMTGQEFLQYTAQYAAHQARVEAYNDSFIHRSLDAAESILPEMGSDQGIRNMVQNLVVANTLNGNNYTAVDAAREVKALLGAAKTEGAQNQRTSITIQKNAAVETPSNQQKTEPTKADKLAKRLKANDASAFDELMEVWVEDGLV